ncbi:hypothetical protein PA598K_05623 [Paenibacillus sp. 598K]|uniref:ABC transporter substrate-binding protein n=1 Tax=Paenibacillus sp. 598K TaxID=1117987 RepID=UPI000FFA7253|nr:ABC transporter substrate-binding protein [Paenibacillus sp. 598K]GBF77099.1 hypothetical protein PA598K_05623 [Paenibacillus sp. 598K]
MLRTKPSLFLLLILLTMLLAACGSAAETPSDPTPPAAGESETPAAEEEGSTQQVEHLKGTSEVPRTIERMVVLSAAYVDHMLTIGEKPAGVNSETRYGADYLPYLADELQGVPTVGSADSPNLEAILDINPDVIVIESRTAENTYEQLEKIAPTIVLGTEWLDYGEEADFWTADLLAIAKLYDKVDVAEARIAEVKEQTAQLRERIQALPEKKLAYLRIREKTLQIYAQKGHPTTTLLYEELGFEPSAVTPTEDREDLSQERIPDLDANFIVTEVDPNGEQLQEEIIASALWQAVPAVAADQVLQTDSFWLFKGWGAIGRSEIMNELTEWLN